MRCLRPLGIALLILSVGPLAHEADASELPDQDYVWVDGHVLRDGTSLKGFYRLKKRSGYRWAPGHYDDAGQWQAPRWRPNKKRSGRVWARGYIGNDGYWVHGNWRRAKRRGFVWVPGQRHGTAWNHGFWRPTKSVKGKFWVKGGWSPKGKWLAGHWRQPKRANYKWVSGRARYGQWRAGYWKPTVAVAGKAWVAGRWHRGSWRDGYWRAAKRPGYQWRRAAWHRGKWRKGAWRRGLKASKTARRYAPPKSVSLMRKERVAKRRLWNKGQAQKARGVVKEQRGKALERRGRATGDAGAIRKGKRLQNKARKDKKRGQRKVRRSRR